jgi:hypothetical protein
MGNLSPNRKKTFCRMTSLSELHSVALHQLDSTTVSGDWLRKHKGGSRSAHPSRESICGTAALTQSGIRRCQIFSEVTIEGSAWINAARMCNAAAWCRRIMWLETLSQVQWPLKFLPILGIRNCGDLVAERKNEISTRDKCTNTDRRS